MIWADLRKDPESGVWYVHESNMIGLHAEAESKEELRVIVRELIDGLLAQ